MVVESDEKFLNSNGLNSKVQIKDSDIEKSFNSLSSDGYKPIDEIYKVATDKSVINWKAYLYDLINREGLDPWDIDLKVLTEKYLLSLKSLDNVDFDVSGKFLTIAVFLLKTKTDWLIDCDIRGIEQKINELQNEGEEFQELLDLEDFGEESLEAVKGSKRKSYRIRCRNPLARKRKVTIFDLIKTLEKTFEQSNRRRRNFLQKKAVVEYEGPNYNIKKRDLKELIEEIFERIQKEFRDSKGHIYFSHLVGEKRHKLNVLEKFLPILHLHNDNKIKISQEKHFDDIKIEKVE